jgi:hypothetical protein
MSTKARATIEDLHNVPENRKAEIVNGELVLLPLAGWRPGLAAGAIFIGLRDYERKTRSGDAYLGNVAYVVRIPDLRTFSPDAAFFRGKPASGH